MKYSQLLYWFAIIGAIIMPACGGSGGDEPIEPDKPDVPIVDVLDPSLVSIVMNPEKDASVIVLRTNQAWTASSDADWLKLSASTGKNSTSIILGVSENKKFKRNAVITVKAGKLTKEINVVQKPARRISLNIRGVSFTLLPVDADTSFYVTGGAYYESRNVYLSSYYISETEITVSQWMAVTGNLEGYNMYSLPSHPVMVNWNVISNVFLPQINKVSGYSFRLPTEVEWYVAAKGGRLSNNTSYPGSMYLDAVAWHYGNSDGSIHKVGMKKSNELGLFDMAGNVSEWCHDWYQEWSDSNRPVDNAKNPMGPASGTEKVVKGGDIKAGRLGENDKNSCEIYRRNHLPPGATVPVEGSPGTMENFVGFRIVLSNAN